MQYTKIKGKEDKEIYLLLLFSFLEIILLFLSSLFDIIINYEDHEEEEEEKKGIRMRIKGRSGTTGIIIIMKEASAGLDWPDPLHRMS